MDKKCNYNRNEKCHCDSGLKHKNCHLKIEEGYFKNPEGTGLVKTGEQLLDQVGAAPADL